MTDRRDGAPTRAGDAPPGADRSFVAGHVAITGGGVTADDAALELLGLAAGASGDVLARLREIGAPIEASAAAVVRSADGRLVVSVAPATAEPRSVVLAPAPVSKAGEADAATAEEGALLLANLAHELRTPLTTLRSALQRIRPEASMPRGDELLEAARRNVERLAGTVTKLLEVAALRAGPLPLRLGRHDPAELLERALADVRGRTGRDDLPEPPSDAGWPEVTCDRRRIVAVLSELLENATQHAPNAELECRLEPDGEGVRFVLADHGPGLAAAELERLSRPFRQGDMSATRTVSGLGVGLTVCRGILAAHGSELVLRPRDGGGLVASFTLTPSDRSGVQTP